MDSLEPGEVHRPGRRCVEHEKQIIEKQEENAINTECWDTGKELHCCANRQENAPQPPALAQELMQTQKAKREPAQRGNANWMIVGMQENGRGKGPHASAK